MRNQYILLTYSAVLQKIFFATTNPSVFQTVFYELGTFQIPFMRTHSGLHAGNVSKLIKIHGDQLSKAPD